MAFSQVGLGPWVDYTPTISSSVGSFTATTSAGKYRIVGKTIEVIATCTITTIGTASGILLISAPITGLSGQVQAGSGLNNTTGVALRVQLPTGGANINATTVASLFPVVQGDTVWVNLTYQAA